MIRCYFIYFFVIALLAAPLVAAEPNPAAVLVPSYRGTEAEQTTSLLEGDVQPSVLDALLDDPGTLPKQTPPSPWYWSTGFTSRKRKAGFHVPAPSLTPLAGPLAEMAKPPSDLGIPGFDDSLGYADGIVGYWASDGSGYFGFNDLNRVEPSRNGESVSFIGYGGTALSRVGRRSDQDFTNGDVGVGPYLRLGQKVTQSPLGTLGWSLTFSMLDSSMGSGRRSPGTALGWQREFQYDYTYFDLLLDRFGNRFQGVVVEPGVFNRRYNTHYSGPKSSSALVEVARWRAYSQAEAQVSTQEWFLSADVTWSPLRRLEVGLSAGPTITMVDAELRVKRGWESLNGEDIPQEDLRGGKTSVEFGFGLEGRARYYLEPKARIWVETHAGYRWLPDSTVQAGNASMSIDASAWEAGVGLGLQLGGWDVDGKWSVSAGRASRTLHGRFKMHRSLG